MRGALEMGLVAGLAFLPLMAAAKDATCDQTWAAYQSVGAPDAPERGASMSDAAYRYRTGAEVFSKTYDAVDGKTADEIKADAGKTRLMEVALRLGLADRLLGCYLDAVTAEDDDGVGFARTFETAMPPEKRAAIVALYKLQD